MRCVILRGRRPRHSLPQGTRGTALTCQPGTAPFSNDFTNKPVKQKPLIPVRPFVSPYASLPRGTLGPWGQDGGSQSSESPSPTCWSQALCGGVRRPLPRAGSLKVTFGTSAGRRPRPDLCCPLVVCLGIAGGHLDGQGAWLPL